MSEKKLKVLIVDCHLGDFSLYPSGMNNLYGLGHECHQSKLFDVRCFSPFPAFTDHIRYKEKETVPFQLFIGGESPTGAFHFFSIPGMPSIVTVEKDGWVYDDFHCFSRNEASLSQFEYLTFFCHSALTYVRNSGWKPDVIHCMGWETGLIPALLQKVFYSDPDLKRIRTVFSIANLFDRGVFDASLFPRTGLPWDALNLHEMEYYGQFSWVKGGVVFSDVMTIPAGETSTSMMTPEKGYGLSGTLNCRRETIFSLPLGVNYNRFHPLKDPMLRTRFSVDDLSGKEKLKQKLNKQFGFKKKNKQKVLVAVSGSFSPYSVEGNLKEIFHILSDMEANFIILGEEGSLMEGSIREWASACSEPNIVFLSEWDNRTRNKIIAGSDVLLIPSECHPLTDLHAIAMAYGTVPVVPSSLCFNNQRVTHNRKHFDVGGAFVYEMRSSVSFLAKLVEVVNAIAFHEQGEILKKNAMNFEFSMTKLVQSLKKVYQEVFLV